MTRRHVVRLVAGLAALAACKDEALVAPQGCTLSTTPTGLIMHVGDTSPLAATGRCMRGTLPPIRWSTSTSSVVTVDSISGVVQARGLGAANVTATVVGMPSVSGVVHVSVSGPTCGSISSVAVTPAQASLVIGARLQLTAIARVGCDSSSSPVSWISADTSIASVDSTGLVTGRRVGPVVISAIARANPNLVGRAAVTVVPGGVVVSALNVTPTTASLPALDTVRIRATVTLGPGTPAGTSTGVTFRSADPCAAMVDSMGLVTALGYGGATRIVVSAIAAPTVTQDVTVNFFPPPPGRSFFLQALTTGTPAVAADPTALRGTVTAVATLMRGVMLGTGRTELWLGGRLAASAPMPRFTPGEQFTLLPLTVNTAARDSSGARLYPNGTTTLELRFTSDGGPVVPGCQQSVPAGWTASAPTTVTLANP